MPERGFGPERMAEEEVEELSRIATIARGDVLTMTYLAGSGHPGGAMSSLDILLVLYSKAHLDPERPLMPDRDRIVISHGHISAGVYAALGRLGFFDVEQAVATFRLAGSPFEGHVSTKVPGVEWDTGNLGQGLSAGCGFALAARLKGLNYHTFVVMSDGEQTKGQVAEARRFAIKYGRKDLTVIIDYNRLQISGRIEEVMPQRIRASYEADGWEVMEIDGHDYQEIYRALREAQRVPLPVAIIAHTVMGKGVSFMEDDNQYHGRALKDSEFQRAMEELGLRVDVERLRRRRALRDHPQPLGRRPQRPGVERGKARLYQVGEEVGNRKAWGQALLDLAELNIPRGVPVVAFDCDLASSVRLEAFAQRFPDHFFEGGIQEHNTATVAGVLSREGVLTFFADFGVFGIDEVYNQQRLNDINGTNLKVICTHTGLDVGQDGNTHHCIDYLGLMRNLFGFKVIVPADPNQTDHAIRFVAREEGNFVVTMGREKEPVIADEEGRPFFGPGYTFRYGKGDLLRPGRDGAIVTMGAMLKKALRVRDALRREGIEVMVINISCPFALDGELLAQAASTGLIVSYEDHHVETGLGAEIAKLVAGEGWRVRLRRLGISSYGLSGTPDELYRGQGLDEETLAEIVKEEVRRCRTNTRRSTEGSFMITSQRS